MALIRLARRIALALAVLLPLALPSAASELRRGNLAEPDTLDPAKWFTTYEANILNDLFNGLLQLDAKGEPIPGAAKKRARASPAAIREAGMASPSGPSR